MKKNKKHLKLKSFPMLMGASFSTEASCAREMEKIPLAIRFNGEKKTQRKTTSRRGTDTSTTWYYCLQ
jgi:hypothetical protein